MPRKLASSAKLSHLIPTKVLRFIGTKFSKTVKKELMKKLMKMSIQVECFIYKNKAITVEIAQNNLQEIIALKALNCHDARTLQVIEKLTRHMKNIIAEAQPQNKKPSPCKRVDPNLTQISCHSNWQRREITSPSLLTNNIQGSYVDLTVESPVKENEHQTQITKPNLKKIRKNVERNINIIQELRVESSEKEQNVQLISATNSNLTIIQKVKRNLNTIPSRMTIEAVPYKDIRSNAYYSQDIFGESQSILQNCDDKIASQRQKIDDLTISVPCTETSMENCKLIKSKTMNVNSKVSDIRKEVQFINKTKKRTNKKSQNKIKKTKKSNIGRSSKYNTGKIANKTKKSKKRSSEYNTGPTTNTPKYERQVAYYQPEKGMESLRYATKNHTEQIVLKHDNIIIHNSSNTTPEQPKMVNYPIENDLSWVENIKYVRQIVPENYDSKLSNLAENLWDNCTFCGLVEPDDFHVY